MKKILVVDDDLDTVEILKIKLEGAGYAVLTARDGQECINKCQQESPDLLIVDVMMPKITGFKVIKLLKGDRSFERTPMIILTARTQEADRRTATSIEADAYITKPFEPDYVLGVVRKLIGSVDKDE